MPLIAVGGAGRRVRWEICHAQQELQSCSKSSNRIGLDLLNGSVSFKHKKLSRTRGKRGIQPSFIIKINIQMAANQRRPSAFSFRAPKKTKYES